MSPEKQARNQIFVSYSHADADYLARLKVHLRPFERLGLVDVWSDTRIHAGQQWRNEIREAIAHAGAAILLISADFLASDYIINNELPPLLNLSHGKGMSIIPVILKPCAYLDIPELASFQAINDPKDPLIALQEVDRERLWLEVAKKAKDAISETSVKLPEEPSPRDQSGIFGFDDELIVLAEEISNPAVIHEYIVYNYEHLDTLAYMRDAREILQRVPEGEQILDNVRERLLQAGWEGDGNIQLLWLPPFLGAGVQDSFGVCVWHVKQRNNGTSWLASPVPLPFDLLLEQNM